MAGFLKALRLLGDEGRVRILRLLNKEELSVAELQEILKTEFMEPMGVSGYALAKALNFPGIYEVVRGERAISADTALRMGKYFALPAQFWLNLQNDYDLRLAERSGAARGITTRAASQTLAVPVAR